MNVRKEGSQIFISLKGEGRMNDFSFYAPFPKAFLYCLLSLMYQLSTAYIYLQQKLNWRWKFFDVIHNTKRWTGGNLGLSLLRNWSEVICSFQYWSPSWQDFNRSIFNSSVQCDPNWFIWLNKESSIGVWLFCHHHN